MDMEKEPAGKFLAVVSAAVAAQVLLEDFSVLLDLSWNVRRVLLAAGLLADIFFAVEFFVRLYAAALARRTGAYILRGGGWIDFFAAVPVLVLWSGPSLLGLFAALPGEAAAAGLLPLFRAGRALRLLRLLKVCRPSGRPAAAVLLAAAVVAALGASALPPEGRFEEAAAYVSAAADSGIAAFARTEEGLLRVRKGGRDAYRRLEEGVFREHFGPLDFVSFGDGGTEFLFSIKPFNAMRARESLAAALVLLAFIPFLRGKSRKNG